eukprot:5520577-Pleurochrysis_carterae.AAC.2
MIPRQHKLDIRGVAAQVDVLAADALNERSSCPHANAPRIARIRAANDAVTPLQQHEAAR